MRRIAATLAVVVALIISAGSAWADLDDAKAVAQRGDFATALQELRPLAKQGVAAAQFQRGNMYRLGRGVPVNSVKAYMWWSLAMVQGNESAPKNLNIIKEEISSDEISIAQELAIEM